ncbi:uncharacterized protein [Solanum lycopersicum]|uniref:uncharacterized protein n=1 Tax=Solanum lycopersicum TaxID=4081 RepID=UPI003749A8A5
MNEGGENNHDHLCDDMWSHLDWNDHQVESGEIEGNKLLDPTGSDTCQPLTFINEVVDVSVNVAKKRSSANRKKKGKKIAEPNSSVDGAEVRRASKHEVHKWTERERRKKMRTLFETLHALVPNLPVKVKSS